MSGLTNRKLKIYGQGPDGRVTVFQDGTAADADATSGYRFDNAFVAGAARPGSAAEIDKDWVDLVELRHDYAEGKSLRIRCHGARTWCDDHGGAARFAPNDRVEFFATAPVANASVALPSWHLNNATPGAQVRLLLGFVESVAPSGDGVVEVTVRDTLSKANDTKVVRQKGTVDIPKLAFNLPSDSPDWYWTPKIVDSGGSPVVGYGESPYSDNRLSVGQILQYLADEYSTTLETDGVLPSGVDLFATTDLALLTQKPGPIVLENVGFAQAVKEVLRWAPDRKLVVDHQTGQWRLVPWGVALKKDAALLYQQYEAVGQPYKTVLRIPFGQQTYFSATPGADGNRIRIYDGETPSLAEEATIYSIVFAGPVGGEYELRLNETLQRPNFASLYNGAAHRSKILPVYAETSGTVVLSVDQCVPGGLKLGKDLRDSYSAVQISSVHQTTETVSPFWYDAAISPRLAPAWDRGFEADWSEKDSDREADKGTDGRGLRVYAIGNDGTHDYLKIRFAESQFGPHHTAHEWDKTTLHVLTRNGGSDVAGNSIVFTILSQTNLADVGDGSAGLKLVLTTPVGGFLSTVGGTFGTQDGAGPYDRCELTHDYRFATTLADNARWSVGRKWRIDETTHIQNATSGPHNITCRPVKVQVDDGTGTARRALALDTQRGFPATNWKPSGAFEYAGGGGPGTFLVWRRQSFYTERPAGAACPGGRGWAAPLNVEATVERTLTTVRTARYPSGSDHGGHAWAAYNLVRTLDFTTDSWTDDVQTPDYELLAEKLFNVYQQAHHRGSVTFPGLHEYGVWLDLAVRVSFGTTLAPFDETAQLSGFWGSVTAVALNFESEEVVLEFDNKGEIADLALEVYEALAIGQKARVSVADIFAKQAKQLAECLASLAKDTAPSALCAGRTYDPGSGRPVPPVIKLPGKDNIAHGIVPASVGVLDHNVAGQSGGTYATHGPSAKQTVVVDQSGAAYRVGDVGELVPGSVSGNAFTDGADPIAGPRAIGHDALDAGAGALAIFGGVALPTPVQPPIFARTDVGSTTTKIVVKAPILPAVASATGWRVMVLDWLDRKPRAIYDLTSISGGTDLNLAAAITDAAGAPAENILVAVLPPLTPRPDASDFAPGSIGFEKDGEWWVWEPTGGNGTVWHATLSGATLSKDTSGSHALALGGKPTAGTGVALTTPGGPAFAFPFYSGGSAILTNQTSAAAFFRSSNANIWRLDLSRFTEVRLSARVTEASTSANTPRLRLRFATTFSTTIGDYSDLGTSEVAAALDATGINDSGWIALDAGAGAADDVFVIVDQIGGDGVADPEIAHVWAEFR